MNTTIRRFNESDWDGLAGAEEFEDGGQPFIGEIKLDGGGDGNEALIVADAETFGVYCYHSCVYDPSKFSEETDHEGDMDEFWSLEHHLKSQTLIENFLRGVYGMVTSRNELEELGFERSI